MPGGSRRVLQQVDSPVSKKVDNNKNIEQFQTHISSKYLDDSFESVQSSGTEIRDIKDLRISIWDMEEPNSIKKFSRVTLYMLFGIIV